VLYTAVQIILLLYPLCCGSLNCNGEHIAVISTDNFKNLKNVNLEQFTEYDAPVFKKNKPWFDKCSYILE
jgi:hypothetical protein